MAGLLAQLPGLLSSFAAAGGQDGSGGLLGSIKSGIGRVLSDIGGSKVHSWGDLGKSIASSAGELFGVHPTERRDMALAGLALEKDQDAANRTTVMAEAPTMRHQRPIMPYKYKSKAPVRTLAEDIAMAERGIDVTHPTSMNASQYDMGGGLTEEEIYKKMRKLKKKKKAKKVYKDEIAVKRAIKGKKR